MRQIFGRPLAEKGIDTIIKKYFQPIWLEITNNEDIPYEGIGNSLIYPKNRYLDPSYFSASEAQQE